MTTPYTVRISDRIVAFLTYFTSGWAGIIYFVLLYIRKKSPSRFLRYNVFQAIFISLLYFLLSEILKIVCNFLLMIPFIKSIISWFILLFNRPFLFQYSFIQVVMITLFLYMAIWSLLGRYPRVPFISNIIKKAAQEFPLISTNLLTFDFA